MFELPEIATLADQINEALTGKVIRSGRLGNSPHKFVWYNRSHAEFERLSRGKAVGKASSKGKWLFVPLLPGYVLVVGEFGGKVLHHAPGSPVPKKYHLHLAFEDGSFLTATTQMWGAIELREKGKEHEGKYVKGMRVTPVERGFTRAYFDKLLQAATQGEKRTAKGLLTQEQLIPGLGNALAQDILFRARLHPKHPISDFTADQVQALYAAIRDTVAEVIAKGGRHDEFDLHGRPGGYIRIMDKHSAGCPCPRCGTRIQKIQYLGGACYFCPSCQALS